MRLMLAEDGILSVALARLCWRRRRRTIVDVEVVLRSTGSQSGVDSVLHARSVYIHWREQMNLNNTNKCKDYIQLKSRHVSRIDAQRYGDEVTLTSAIVFPSDKRGWQ